MSSLDQISISLEGLAHVLADNQLKVPTFQRSFAWEKSHVSDLLQDIGAAIQKRAKEYFLGSIVVATENHAAYEVVDGQQRLATTSIILAAIRDRFVKMGDEKRAQIIDTMYLLKTDLRTQEAVPKIILNEFDNDYYRKVVLTLPGAKDRDLEPARRSHERLRDAQAVAADHIGKLCSTTNRPAELLLDWVDYLHQSAKVILVTVPDHANAFTIFETLNDRGLDLAISDLLKNHLFSLAGNRLPEAQAAWAAMLGGLASVTGETSTVDYIRHYWSSKHGATRERELYAVIRKDTSSKQSAIDLANELEQAARRYAAILSYGHEFWNDYGAGTRQHIELINLLRMVQVRPLLLAILDKFSLAEAKKALRLIVSWGVRFLVHGGLGGGVLERHYCDRAQEIVKGATKTAGQLAKAMVSVVPSDAEFEGAFSRITLSQAYLARYYLRALEQVERGEPEPELVPNPNEQEINLEHVLPLKPGNNWPHFDDDSLRAHQKRLGNMVLLQQKMNSALRSAPFARKRSVLSQSAFKLTSAVGKETSWDKAQIEERQAHLAKLALRAWPLR